MIEAIQFMNYLATSLYELLHYAIVVVLALCGLYMACKTAAWSITYNVYAAKRQFEQDRRKEENE